MMKRFRIVFAVGSVLWVVSLPLAAIAASAPRLDSMPAVRAIVFFTYAIGSLICHQRPERSFRLAGSQLPVCARCTGIYAGAALTALFAVIGRRGREERRNNSNRITPTVARRLLLAGGTPALVTVLVEWATGQMPGHWIRAMSGLPLGGAVAWIVSVSLEQDPFQRAGGEHLFAASGAASSDKWSAQRGRDSRHGPGSGSTD
jgi:peptidoglycan/LPS O-acetylase OafA/YrhL